MEKESIKKIIEELMSKMGVDFDEVLVEESPERVRFLIKTSESGLLIGSRGEHFDALDHLVKRVVYRNNHEVKIRFSLDVNDYREEQLRNIKKRALELAEQVKASKESIEMEPMSSYERMVIHSLFSDDPYIETESVTKDDGRRIVLKCISI